MEKLLSLGPTQFTTPESVDEYFPSDGIWSSASFSVEDTKAGVYAQIGSTSIGGVTVVDNPIAGVSRITSSSAAHLYMIGSSGHFYDLDLFNTASISDKRSGTPITNPANGIAIFKPNGGTEYLFYWQQSQIGRWDLVGAYPTGWTDNHFAGLQSTSYHPVHTFAGNVYYGNKDRIGMIYDNSGTAANNTNVLDFPSDYTVLDLTDDGTYLVATISKNLGGTSLGDTKVIFWDTVSSSWNKEYKIDDPYVVSLQSESSTIYAVGRNNLYVFNYDTAPRLIKSGTFNAGATPYGASESVLRFNNLVTWDEYGASTVYNNSQLDCYGKLSTIHQPGLYRPYALATNGGTTFMYWDGTTLITGTGNAKLLSWNTRTASGPTTIYFDLQDVCKIERIDLNLTEGIDAESDGPTNTITITAYTSNNHNESYTFGTLDSVIDGTNIQFKKIYPASDAKPLITRFFKLALNLNLTSNNIDAVGIVGLTVYGERLSA